MAEAVDVIFAIFDDQHDEEAGRLRLGDACRHFLATLTEKVRKNEEKRGGGTWEVI